MQSLAGILLGWAIALGVGCAAVAEGPAPAEKLTIVIEGPSGPALRTGPFDISVRVFEADDPDAPPQVTNIAVHTVAVADLAQPLTVEIDVPAARLAGALRPAVGAIVSSKGNLAYWTEMFVPLERSGPTRVRLAPVP